MFCARAQFRIFTLAALIVACGAAEVHGASRNPIEVQSVRVVPGDNGPIIEIVSSAPLTPKLQTVEGPLRLVIDLPDAMLNAGHKKIVFRNEQVQRVRMNQYQSNPAVTRVVVDLAAPVRYTWDAMGNRLRIRLRADEAAVAKPPSVPALAAGPQPIAVPVAVGTSGSLIEIGNRVAAGSAITAGDETAILRLNRGGEVLVCPGTTVSISTSPTGHDLMLGMSQGAMETHYGLQESVDSVLTPDFRVVLPGPGEFNLAISADAHGNTCIASLPGSSSSAVIAELIGNGTYEIKPEQQVLFHKGQLNMAEPAIAPCGCPPAQEPVLRATADPASVIPASKAGQKLQVQNSDASVSTPDPPSGSQVNREGGSQPADPKVRELKVVEAPLVFSGREMARAKAKATSPTPAPPLTEVAALSLTERPDPLPTILVLPPASDPKPQHRGFFGKVKRLFGF